MDIKIVRQINKTTRLEITLPDEGDTKEALLKAQFFMEIPYACGACHGDNIRPLSVRRVVAKEGKNAGEEFIYVEAYCFDCHAKKSTGEYKAPKGSLFWKGEWAVYDKNAKASEGLIDGD